MQYSLRLYVAGRTARSQLAIENLDALCKQGLEEECDVEVIDILANPELADVEKILATPTLIKYFPGPMRKIIGDLNDLRKVERGLDLRTHQKRLQSRTD